VKISNWPLFSKFGISGPLLNFPNGGHFEI